MNMDFEPGWAILAGLIGGAMMATTLYLSITVLPQHMKMNLFKLRRDLRRDEAGLTMLAYALGAAIIVVPLGAAVLTLGTGTVADAEVQARRCARVGRLVQPSLVRAVRSAANPGGMAGLIPRARPPILPGGGLIR